MWNVDGQEKASQPEVDKPVPWHEAIKNIQFEEEPGDKKPESLWKAFGIITNALLEYPEVYALVYADRLSRIKEENKPTSEASSAVARMQVKMSEYFLKHPKVFEHIRNSPPRRA